MSRRLSRHTFAVAAAAIVAAAAGGGVAMAQAVSGGDSGSRAAAANDGSPFAYGAVPTWLPQPRSRPDGTERGTARHPTLTAQGDVVRAVLPHHRGSVDIQVAGPEIPGEGFSYQPDYVTTTFTVTLSGATAAIPVALSSFSAFDSAGGTHAFRLVSGDARPPRIVRPGRTVRFQLRTVLPVGEGMLRWAPLDDDLLATWDFVSEND